MLLESLDANAVAGRLIAQEIRLRNNLKGTIPWI